MKRRLGNLERQLLAYAQLRKVRELRTGELQKPLGMRIGKITGLFAEIEPRCSWIRTLQPQ